MQSKRLGLGAVMAIFTVALFATGTCVAQQETVLHSFGSVATDGTLPWSALIFDSTGNLYGTTSYGGVHGTGTAFKLSPNGSGGWTETALHGFGSGTDASNPYGGLIFDGAGNLYGTGYAGGIHGYGAVFELSPNGSGGWTETVLHSFGGGTDGQGPDAGLIFDAAGNLYGTTVDGGIHGKGTLFELSPRAGGGWTETVLHSFGNPATQDGQSPDAGLVFDANGNLYGTTVGGGIHITCGQGIGCGTVFELSPNGSGGWTEVVLHSFGSGTDGWYPYSALILDSAGDLYGTTYFGGIHVSCSGGESCGTVFELSPRQGGGWTETVLHSFGNGNDGTGPWGGLIFDTAGNLYGTTFSGGIHSLGTAFEMSPRQGGGWTETVLHSFGSGSDGSNPVDSLIFDATGNLYGTASAGGLHGSGTAFKLIP